MRHVKNEVRLQALYNMFFHRNNINQYTEKNHSKEYIKMTPAVCRYYLNAFGWISKRTTCCLGSFPVYTFNGARLTSNLLGGGGGGDKLPGLVGILVKDWGKPIIRVVAELR